MGQIVAEGDRPAHRCDLPRVPTYEHPPTQTQGFRSVPVLNAVAACSICGRLYVSREAERQAHDIPARWVPLHWWHFKAKANLRVEQARRIGGVAE